MATKTYKFSYNGGAAIFAVDTEVFTAERATKYLRTWHRPSDYDNTSCPIDVALKKISIRVLLKANSMFTEEIIEHYSEGWSPDDITLNGYGGIELIDSIAPPFREDQISMTVLD